MMPTPPITPEAPQAVQSAVSPEAKKLHTEFRSRIDACKQYRRKLIPNWNLSIDYRRGKPFASQTDDDQVAVNLDWALTKHKTAALFSQVPQVRLSHGVDTLPSKAAWATNFQNRLNDLLIESGIESAMDECLPDCINAAGIGAVMVSFESITENKDVPSIDMSTLSPELAMQAIQTGMLNGMPIPMESVPQIVDRRYLIQRISPADLLWPINFTGANFDNGPWIGRSGRVTWATAVSRFNLTEKDRAGVLGEERIPTDRLTNDSDRDKDLNDEMVSFDEIFYLEHQYDVNAKSFKAIHHLVFVGGKSDPVVDEPWKGQRVEEDGTIVGSLKYAIRALTLTYITDETIPPSDSAIGRPQVNEINKARTQMIKQRERSLPVRWFNVDRIDPAIQQSLMRGTWQAMIPVQGEGSRVIGEVARASMPQENFMFDKIAKADLHNEWTSPNTGMEDGEGGNKEEGDNPRQVSPQVGRERAKVGSFFVGIAEVLGGLMALYEDPSMFGEGFSPAICKVLKFSILADSTVLLDANQKLARMNQFMNAYAKSGWINIEAGLQQIATLAGLDPSVMIKAPTPKPPVEPNISLRLTGVEDLLNPLALAMLITSGQAPNSQAIEQAKGLIQQAVVPPQGLQMPGAPQALGGFPMLPEGAPLPPPAPAPPPGIPLPAPPVPKVGEANPHMTPLEPMNKRTEGGGTQ